MESNGPRPETAAEDRDSATPDALFRAHGPAVFAVCLANTQNHHDAEDIMQAVFLKSIAKASTVREPARVRAWLMQVARRLCVDFHRKRKPMEPLAADPPIPPSQSEIPCRRLHEAIQKLPQNYREAIVLYYLDGRKCSGVAASLGTTEPAVRQRLVPRQGDAPRSPAGGPNMKPAKECKDRFEDIVAFVMGELDANAVGQLQGHLEVCKACRATYDALVEEENEVRSGFEAFARSLVPRPCSIETLGGTAGLSSSATRHFATVEALEPIDQVVLEEWEHPSRVRVGVSNNHFLERVKNMILAHKRLSVAAAATATALAASVVLYVSLFSSSRPAYALEQTVQANSRVTSYHAKLTPPVGMSEVWVQLRPDGTPLRARIDYPETEDGSKVVIFSEGRSGVWFLDKKIYSISPEKDALKRVKSMQKLCDPRIAFEELQARKKTGAVEIETREPAKEGDFLTLTVTPKNVPNLREVFEVNPQTKLAERVTYYGRQDDRWEQVKVVEYFDYSKEIDPKVFNPDFPKDVIILDDITTKPGLVKGDLSNEEIATKVAREFFEALIAKNYEKAGLIYGGFPAERMKEEYGRLALSRIVEIGRPTAGIHPDPTTLAVLVKVECGARKWVQEFSPQVRLTDGETATKTVREFCEAIIHKDEVAARRILDEGLMFEGFSAKNAAKVKELFEHYKLLRIVEVGKPVPSPGTKLLEIPVKVEVEMKSERIKKFRPFIRPVYNQPDRWGICGGI